MEIIKSENDFYTSVEKSLDEIDSVWRGKKGLIVLGSHAPTDVDLKLAAIKDAREKGTPFLGICFGMQLMCIEHARSCGGVSKASTEELSGDKNDLIHKLPKLRVGMFSVDSWYATQGESHWHHYALNPHYKEHFNHFFDISWSDGGDVAEVMRLRDHPFFVGVQFHPEYQSTKEKPHPVLRDFISACK